MLKGLSAPPGCSLRRAVHTLRPRPSWNDHPRLCRASALIIKAPRHGFHAQQCTFGTSSLVLEEPVSVNDSLRETGAIADVAVLPPFDRDPITEALLATRGGHIAAGRSPHKVNISLASIQSLSSQRRPRRFSQSDTKLSMGVARDDSKLTHTRSPVVATKDVASFRSILARYLKHVHAHWDAIRLGGEVPGYILTEPETQLINAIHAKLSDIHHWAMILREEVLPTALKSLYTHTLSRGPDRGSLVVLSYLLRRSDFSPKALSCAIEVARLHSTDPVFVPRNGIRTSFLLFLRLIRHARAHAPGKIPAITSLFLAALPQHGELPADAKVDTALQGRTFLLNKALHLVCLPTSTEPFRNALYQEQALILLLRYMADHKPTIQLNRSGYRAVIALQLSFGKTDGERRWAQLKALSWPPWKVDRTQMDANITHNNDGVSRAAKTLKRMREAGYAPLDWEKTAQLYTGWDTDGTPVIQTRVLMQQARGRHLRAALWVARINTTRTIQEAWAAYLAYEHNHKTPHPDVLRAIFAKLHQEAMRRRVEHQSPRSNASFDPDRESLPVPIQAGDAREISPLPPSMHLHTYTHTPPPTVAEFYTTLRERNIKIGLESLIFLVRHAPTLGAGVEYLRDAKDWLPRVVQMLSPNTTSDPCAGLPDKLFDAYINLLCRFPNKSRRHFTTRPAPIHTYPLGRLRLSRNVAIGEAIYLVRRCKHIKRTFINSILSGLSKQQNNKAMSDFLHVRGTEECSLLASIIINYKLARTLIEEFEQKQQVLDQDCLLNLYRIIEGSLRAIWQMALEDDSPQREHTSHSLAKLLGYDDAVDHAFQLFARVCDYDDTLDAPSTYPNPAIWHALIRLTGFAGDFERLAQVVQLMMGDSDGLATVAQRYRMGPRVMQRSICAARVMLERRWLQESVPVVQQSSVQGQLFAKAPAGLVDRVKASVVDDSTGWLSWPSEENADNYWKNSDVFLLLRTSHTNMYNDMKS